MNILGISRKIDCDSIRQLLMNWWMNTSSKTVIDLFRHNIPGIICWFVWKYYTGIIWGNNDNPPTTEHIIFQIEIYMQAWASSFSILIVRSVGDVLFEEKLIPKNFKTSGGGTHLRNQNGELVAAISFPLIASTSLEAEIQAILTATGWAIGEGNSQFLV
ncbi:unnamed protein product [Cuscuta europaea]|uniref:RNase H type-1 domain-containing protein n=1 Tax=Cuscuta europaea TaxID=41803 RepID=A0A9P1ELB4_CUSEU|nr:unnamed protein product [Cuscuta europaea]